MNERKKQPYGYPYFGIVLGIAFAILGILAFAFDPSIGGIFGFLLIIFGLGTAIYYLNVANKRCPSKNTPQKIAVITLAILLILSSISSMHMIPKEVHAAPSSWSGSFPDNDTVVNMTLGTYNHDTHGEVGFSANLYEIDKDHPQPGQCEFAISVVSAANSRYKMGYTVGPPTGNTYTWYDPLNSLTLGDNQGQSVDLTNPIFVYGGWYDKVFITSNGYVILDKRAYNDNGGKWTSPVPKSIPTTDEPNILIAPLWRDLDPSKGGTIRYGENINTHASFVVEWDNVPNKVNNDKRQKFEVVFYYFPMTRDYGIDFLYDSITNDVPTSIGIEDQTGKRGHSIASVTSPQTWFFHPWVDNYYSISDIKVSASKFFADGTNDNKANIDIGGLDDTRPGGINVKLDSPSEGTYTSFPIISAVTLSLSTLALASGYAFIGYVGYTLATANFVYQLSPMPRESTVKEADQNTKTGYVLALASDEKKPGPGTAWDASIAPLIIWRILDTTTRHYLEITTEITYYRPDGTTYTLTTGSLYITLYPAGSGTVGGEWIPIDASELIAPPYTLGIQSIGIIAVSIAIISIATIAAYKYKKRNT